MPLYGDDIYEDEMYPAIGNLFSRSYQRGCLLIRPYVHRPYAAMNDKPDFVYIRAYNQIHVVEAKRSAAYIYDAIDQLQRYRGNFKYVALPNGEYFYDEEYINEAIERRFGLILVRRTGRGLSADFYRDSRTYSGNFIQYYED